MCLKHWNGSINTILGLVLIIAQVYPARPENIKSLGKPRAVRFSQPRRINLSYIQHQQSILFISFSQNELFCINQKMASTLIVL